MSGLGLPCRMQCGFFSSPGCDGMCTQCYKLHVQGETPFAGTNSDVQAGPSHGLLEPPMPSNSQGPIEEETRSLSPAQLSFRRGLLVGSKMDVQLDPADEDAQVRVKDETPAESTVERKRDAGVINQEQPAVWRDAEVHRAVLNMLLVRYTEWELKLEWISRFSPRIAPHKTRATKRPPREDLPDYSAVETKLGPESLPYLKDPGLLSDIAKRIPKDRYKGMSVTNILESIDTAIKQSPESLESKGISLLALWEYVEMYAEPIMRSKQWLKAPKSLVLKILARDFLNASEIEIYFACERWAQANKTEGVTVQETAKDLMPLVRFGSITTAEIAAKVVQSPLLPQSQQLELFLYHAKTDPRQRQEQMTTQTLKFCEKERLARPSLEQGDGGQMVIISQPGDNSCLFHSVGYVCDGEHALTTSEAKRGKVMSQRKRVSDMIKRLANTPEDPLSSSAILGMTSDVYSNAILEMSKWGGALDLQLFAQIFQCEIYSFDLYGPNVYRFGVGKGENYRYRVFVAYSGNHYDALEYQNPFHKHRQRYFSVTDGRALQLAKECVEGHFRKSNKLAADEKVSWLGQGLFELSALRQALPAETKTETSQAAPMQAWNCSVCTLLNPGNRTICSVCGNTKVARRSSPWKCVQCETRNPAERNFCSVCDARSPDPP
eukprot:gb/GEZN01002759.1/.p1 GENE.gb/GEZN01002759.1/~~gb/GEZN01002759.1/.p1  ORF type:complete len:678 (+),score=98.36 gb/GEZN01002759.1/:43-2034(+)